MARYRPEHKQETQWRLVESAVSTLRRDGVESAGLKEIMQELGLTVGGFYRHFPSKSALVEAAVARGIDQSLDRMRKVHHPGGPESIERFSAIYLCEAHRRSLAEGCVLAALSSDIARGDASVKAACEAGLRRIYAEVESQLPRDDSIRQRVWALLALEMGGLLLSRMVASDLTSARILESCRQSVARLVRPEAPGRPRKKTVPRQSRARRPKVRSPKIPDR